MGKPIIALLVFLFVQLAVAAENTGPPGVYTQAEPALYVVLVPAEMPAAEALSTADAFGINDLTTHTQVSQKCPRDGAISRVRGDWCGGGVTRLAGGPVMARSIRSQHF